MSPLVASLGWLLAVAATFTATPQLIRLIRSEKNGFEPLTPALAFSTMVGWVIFTASIHDIPALASSVGPLIVWASTLGFCVARGVPQSKRALFLAIGAFALFTLSRIFSLIPVSWFGILAAFGSTIWAIPQLVKVLRLRGSDLSGVSSLAYLLLALENASWILYAIGMGVAQYALAPLIQLPACLAIAMCARNSEAKILSTENLDNLPPVLP